MLSDYICKFVAIEPRATSEICEHFKDVPRATVRTAVSRLVQGKKLFRPKLRLTNGNSVVTNFPNFEDARLLKKLRKTNFYGRENIALLLDHMQVSLPSVSVVDVAKVAVLRIGKEPKYDWQEAMALLEALVEIGAVKKDETRDGVRWNLNKKLFLDSKLPFNSTNLNPAYMAIRERMRSDLGQALGKWLMQNSFVSPGMHVINHKRPVISYGYHPFDFLGFSFAKGIAIRKSDTITHKSFVGDIALEICSISYAKSFKKRVDEANFVTGEHPAAFILAKGFSKDAFKFLKQEGILAWTVDQVFGKKTAGAIEDTLKICNQLIRQLEVNPKLFIEALDGLENFEGIFGNLKGKLFEIMVAYLISKLGFENVQISRPVPNTSGVDDDNPDAVYDLDVYGALGIEGLLIECKGILKDSFVEDSEVAKHFQKRSPQMRNFMLRTPQNKITKFRSIVVTSGNFTEVVLKDFDEGKFKSKPDTTLELWDRTKLLGNIRDAGEKELVKVLERFYK